MRRWLVLAAVVVLILAFGSGMLIAIGAADIRTQWLSSKHANRELARDEATVETRGVTAAHCGRCHAEQGFVAWLPQLRAGNIGLITMPGGQPATRQFLLNLGLTKFSVRPITCNACHTNTEEGATRISGSTPLLPAGFAAQGIGKGALCATCHNTRNGKQVWDNPDPRRYTAPHVAAQADVLMGQNGFLLSPLEARVSPHAIGVKDACVTCHMTLSENSHTFRASKGVCVNCHGAKFNADNVQEKIEELLASVREAMVARVLANKDRIATIRSWDPKTDTYTDNFAVDPAQIVNAEPTEIHGQQGWKFLLTNKTALYSQMGDIKDASGKPVFPTSDILVRAGWNYYLIHSDGSEGVHNPRFARDLLIRSLEAVKAAK